MNGTVFAVALIALHSWLTPAPVHAHGNNPPYIAFWGPFDPATALCQQRLGQAGQHCFDEVLRIERDCMQAQLAGHPCDDTARKNQISAARQAGQVAAGAACTDNQARLLIFTGLGEATADLANACADQPAAVMSLLYAPVQHGSAADEDASRCMERTSTVAMRMLRFIVHNKRRTLDKMAIDDLKPSQRLARINNSATHVAAARAVAARLITSACPQFESIYSSTLAEFLVNLELRGDCVVFAGYVQSAVTCPLPVCGNGIKEAGEACDDGNTVDGDACPSNCTPPLGP